MDETRRIEIWTLSAAAVLALFVLGLRSKDIILFNNSPSIPRGFYLRVERSVEVNSIVTVRARDVARNYAELRHFTDEGDRFIKRVAAGEGDRVCVEDNVLTINGQTRGQSMQRDSVGRELPHWSGCGTLHNAVLLLGDTPDSFDGRYWGPVSVSSLEGVWRPLWVW